MNRILKPLLFLFAVGALAAGAGLALAPTQLAQEFAIVPSSLAGLGTLRANLAACFLLMGSFTLAGLRPGHAHWLTVPAVLMSVILALRLLHLGLDGVSDGALRSTAVEALVLPLLLAGRRVLALAKA